MNNFLDKVGLQHVIEKIKGLLSGYLSLEKGGTIGTGAPTTKLKGGNITLEGVFGIIHKPGTFIKKALKSLKNLLQVPVQTQRIILSR